MGEDVGHQELLERRVVPRITGVDIPAEKFVCADALVTSQCGQSSRNNKKRVMCAVTNPFTRPTRRL